ncbi:MAG TPA: glucokinase [Sphingomonas sp.]|nr:glucokinase [Sphingomonas sp.]
MDQDRKLAVAIDDDTITMAWVGDGQRQIGLERWPIGQFSTLTDALLAFERSAGKPLLGAACALGVLGATHGETIMLSRGNWAINRSGLRSVFKRDPIVINDVAARAWAALGGAAPRLEPLSPSALNLPDFSRPGRWALTKVDAGVGLAVIDVDQSGLVRVLECEMGHCGFAPATAEERALGAALATRATGPVSWEMVLTILPDDPIWSAPGLPTGRAPRMEVIAGLAGRYVGDTVLAHGAWTGAILTGKRITDLLADPVLPAFNAGFETKPKFVRLMRAAPRWRLAGHDLTMAGCAIALERHPAMLKQDGQPLVWSAYR